MPFINLAEDEVPGSILRLFDPLSLLFDGLNQVAHYFLMHTQRPLQSANLLSAFSHNALSIKEVFAKQKFG